MKFLMSTEMFWVVAVLYSCSEIVYQHLVHNTLITLMYSILRFCQTCSLISHLLAVFGIGMQASPYINESR